jgi:hypothetical protein
MDMFERFRRYSAASQRAARGPEPLVPLAPLAPLAHTIGAAAPVQPALPMRQMPRPPVFRSAFDRAQPPAPQTIRRGGLRFDADPELALTAPARRTVAFTDEQQAIIGSRARIVVVLPMKVARSPVGSPVGSCPDRPFPSDTGEGARINQQMT